MSKEDLEAGRQLGGLAKAGFDTKRLREIARKRRKKVSEVLAEALSLYEMVYLMEDVDPRCLAAGLQLAEHLMLYATRILSETSKIYSSDMVQHVLQSYASALAQTGQHAQGPTEKPQAPTADMATSLAPAISSLVSALTSALLNVLAPLSRIGQQAPLPGSSTPQPASGVRIVE